MPPFKPYLVKRVLNMSALKRTGIKEDPKLYSANDKISPAVANALIVIIRSFEFRFSRTHRRPHTELRAMGLTREICNKNFLGKVELPQSGSL